MEAYCHLTGVYTAIVKGEGLLKVSFDAALLCPVGMISCSHLLLNHKGLFTYWYAINAIQWPINFPVCGSSG